MSNNGFLDDVSINELVATVLEHACSCLEASTTGVPKYCFISHGEPPEDCCDFMAVWLDRIFPVLNFPIAEDVNEHRCDLIRGAADINLQIRRPCWPGPENNAQAPFPAPAKMQAAAEDLLVDAKTLWCCITGGMQDAVVEALPEFEGLGVRWGTMKAHADKGICVGWDMDLWFELPQCCG